MIDQGHGESLSISVQRSRRTGLHRAYVRVGVMDAGFRDLDSGAVQCTDPVFEQIVRTATADLMIDPVRIVPARGYEPRHLSVDSTASSGRHAHTVFAARPVRTPVPAVTDDLLDRRSA